MGDRGRSIRPSTVTAGTSTLKGERLMSEALFLELEDHVGLEPSHYEDKTGEVKEHPNAGQPGPLVSEGCDYAVPTLVNGKIQGVKRHVQITVSESSCGEIQPVALDQSVTTDARIIPGSRVIETTNPLLADVLCQGGYRRIDPPSSQRPHVAKAPRVTKAGLAKRAEELGLPGKGTNAELQAAIEAAENPPPAQSQDDTPPADAEASDNNEEGEDQ